MMIKAKMMQPAMSEVVTQKPGMYLGALLEGQMYDPLRALYQHVAPEVTCGGGPTIRRTGWPMH
jgi:hypothetical protein